MILTLLGGCFFISDEEHAARLAAACPDTADTDTDTDADTDTDTDADTDTDTGGLTGRLSGTITMNVEGTTSPSDTCEGEVIVQVDDDDALLGSFVCRFGGLGIYEDQSGTIEGDVSGGDMTFTTDFDTTIQWTGSVGGAPSLDGQFEASEVPWNLDRLTLFGSFRATPD